MFDHVERRRFLVQPARKHTIPALVGLLDIDLNESAGQLFRFPGRGRLARPQSHDHILPADRLARVERHRLDDAVTLVEYAQCSQPLGHRSDAAFAIGGGPRLPSWRQRHILILALAARGERQRDQQRCRGLFHAYSGIQGS
jgi:hypothetical protein